MNKLNLLRKRINEADIVNECLIHYKASDFYNNRICNRGTFGAKYDMIGCQNELSPYIFNGDYIFIDGEYNKDRGCFSSVNSLCPSSLLSVDFGKSISLELDFMVENFSSKNGDYQVMVDFGSILDTSCGFAMNVYKDRVGGNLKFTKELWWRDEMKPTSYCPYNFIPNVRYRIMWKFINNGNSINIYFYINNVLMYSVNPIYVDLNKQWNRFNDSYINIGRSNSAHIYWGGAKWRFYELKLTKLDND